MKKEVDKFINIAAGGKKLTGDIKRLKEVAPIKFTHFNMEKGTEIVPIQKEKSEEKLYKEYLIEKSKLRKYYDKFLKKYSTNIDNNEVEIKDFYYKKEENKSDLIEAFSSIKGFKKIKTPHYIGITGKWTSYYKTTLNISKEDLKEYILRFESVDYECNVYINGICVKTHTGFFAPFEVNITDYIKSGSNQLLLVVKNDLTTSGIDVDGFTHYGDKIYAATNIGYDEPNLGWHHCPAGIGVIGKILLITSNKQRIIDSFIKTNINDGTIKIQTTLVNYLYYATKLNVSYKIEGRNFKCSPIEFDGKIDTIQIGNNILEEQIKIKNFKLWTLKEPYLYDLLITLKNDNEDIISQYQAHFGMREFYSDEKSKPYKGAFYFNKERIILRGTNEMGHLQRCVMEDNDEQLIDDILIAKVAGLNYYRMTQRPALKKVYDYFDMLGMLCQSDFPLFSYITDSSLGEAYKQVDEMERLTRNHPSVIIESLCNETLDKTAWGKEQYVLSRLDMEKFFDISKGIIHLLNPERVIKYSEGDYAPLKDGYGLNDFHLYTYWYISHGLPSGKMRKGYLPPIRHDYMCGCGEYGVDGLDSLEIMKKYAPKSWLPKNINDKWSPKVIAKEQCYVLHSDFFPEENDINSWIAASRNFQKVAIKDYVDLLRFRSDYIQSTAVHLLIDSWPMGWTKTLVDVSRKPKPAYYSFKDANKETRIYLRKDKSVIYNNDTATIEVYAFNDNPNKKEVSYNVSIHYLDHVENYSGCKIVDGVSTTYLGDVIIKVNKDYVGDVIVTSNMKCDDINSYDKVTINIKKPNKKANKLPVIKSNRLNDISKLCLNKLDKNVIFTDDNYYSNNKKELEKKVLEGAKVVVFASKPFKVLKDYVVFKTHTLEEEVRANNLIYSNPNNDYTKEFDVLDFQNFYNKEKDYQDLTAWFKFYDDRFDEILYTLEDSNDEKYKFHKRHKLIMGEMKYGKGKIIVSTLSCLNGCIGNNPILDKLMINLIEK